MTAGVNVTIHYKQAGEAKELVTQLPSGEVNETNVSHALLEHHNDGRELVEVPPYAAGLNRLRKQMSALNITDISWDPS